MTAFTEALMQYRRQAFFLNRCSDFSLADYKHCGYPDLSYHSEEAWKAQLYNYNRHIGILYADKVSPDEVKLAFVAYNMHWENKTFSLPIPPKNMRWYSVLASGNVTEEETNRFTIEGRSICIFEICKEQSEGL